MITGLETALLAAGGIIVAASFIFSAKADGKEKEKADIEFTDRQKQDIKKQIEDIFEEQADDVKDRTEIALDKLSNEKMLEMNEYSDTILSEINRNHNEVMFLYDMLNEKKKEINITVRDINIAKKELDEKVKSIKSASENEAPDASDEVFEETDTEKDDFGGFMAGEKILEKEKKDSAVFDGEDVSDGMPENGGEEKTPVKKTRKKASSTGKTAAKRLKETVNKETTRKRNPGDYETGNNNEKILKLASKGKSNIEIAKELGLGIGEVKLVIDLFKGGR